MRAPSLLLCGLLSAAVASAAEPALPEAAAPQAASPQADGARAFKLDGRSALLVRTWRDGARASLAHDHVVKATELAGEGTFDAAHPEALQVKVTVQAATLLIDDPADRALVGLTDTVPDKDKKAAEEALKGRETLDVKRFPTISFRSTGCARGGDGALVLSGDFTLHGVTRAVKMPIALETAADGTVRGTAVFTLKTSDFGIKPYSAFLGAVKVKDEVDFRLSLVGVPK